MRITPRSLVLASAIVAAAAFTAHTAAAETVKVPFDFKVNGQTMPAGQYLVLRNGLSNFVSLESPSGSQVFTWGLKPGDPTPTSNEVKVSFIKDGDGYDLHGIQYHSRVTPRIDKLHSEDSAVHVLRGE